jgi:hypothetical protein
MAHEIVETQKKILLLLPLCKSFVLHELSTYFQKLQADLPQY